MSKRETNKVHEMEVFVRSVELGSFSAAARSLFMTPSAVSKLVSRLEARLGLRLISRSTRDLQLTGEGRSFFDSSVAILASIDAAEHAISTSDRPSGCIRINTSASYGTHILAPLVPAFLTQYPDIELDIVQTDKVVDLVSERTDVAIRAGPLSGSTLIARKLGETALTLVASPEYIERAGRPRHPDDLDSHVQLAFDYKRAGRGWPFKIDGQTIIRSSEGRVRASDGEALRVMAVNGAGIARLAYFTARQDIEAGRLVSVLEAFTAGEREAFHAVYVGQGGQLPNRVRVLLDFLFRSGRVS